MNWLDDLTIDDLPEIYKEMAAIIGVKITIKLAEHYAKMPFYFRSLDDMIAEKKREYIFAKFTGANHAELARATGYSVRWVYEILKGGKDDRQSSMF